MAEQISRLYNFQNDKAARIPISPLKVDNELDAIISALNKKVLIRSSAPSSPVDGQTWIDISQDPPVFKIYDQSAQGWTPATVYGDFGVYSEKTTPVDDDKLVINDSQAGNALKHLKRSNLLKGSALTFESIPILPATDPTTDNQATRRKFVVDSIEPKFHPTTGHDHNGVNSRKISGNQLSAWESKSNNVVYQAATDGFVFAFGYHSGGATSQCVRIYSDSSNPPTTIRANCGSASAGYYAFGCSAVKKNDYYQVVIANTAVGIYFIPLGS